MPDRGRHRSLAWALLAVIAAAGALVVVLSPAERTLGQAVKVVYVHVALSRAGAVGLYAAGLLGLAVIAWPAERLAWWMRAVAWAGLSLFALGFAVSGLAQWLSWGGITWREPRVAAGANVLAVALIVQIANGWLPWLRLRGVLRLLVAGLQLWTTLRAPNVLHPGDAIRSSGSAAIINANSLLFLLALLLGAGIVALLWLYRAPEPAGPAHR